MSYTLPGVVLSESRGAPTPFLSAIHRKTVLVGKIASYVEIKSEPVIRSSTGYTDNFEFGSDGVLSILIVESLVGMRDFVVTRDYVKTSTGIMWTSTGSIPDDGATYYVSYRKVRQDDEYLYFESRNVEEMYAQGGYPSGDKEEAILYGQIAFNTYGIPIIGIQPVKPPYTAIKYQEAINLLTNRDVQTLLTTSSDSTVRATAVTHVKNRSLAVNKRERIFFSGMPVLSTPTEIGVVASAYTAEEFTMISITRAKVTMFNFDTNEEEEVAIDGAGVACLIGLWRDTNDDPSYSLLRNKLSGFELYEADYETYFTDDALETFGDNGVLQIVPYKDNYTIPMIVDEITTDGTNAKTSSIAVITAKHYNTKTVREAIDDTFTGRKIVDPTQYAGLVRNFLIELFAKLRNAGSIASFEESDIQVRVGTSFDGLETNPSKVWLAYKYYAIYVHKQTEGSYQLLP